MPPIYVIEKWYQQIFYPHGKDFVGYLPGFYCDQKLVKALVKDKNAKATQHVYRVKRLIQAKAELATEES